VRSACDVRSACHVGYGINYSSMVVYRKGKYETSTCLCYG